MNKWIWQWFISLLYTKLLHINKKRKLKYIKMNKNFRDQGNINSQKIGTFNVVHNELLK